MRCFVHPSADAVALCRSCFKGVCASCAIPAGLAVACSPVCATNAERMMKVVEVSGRNAGAVQRTQGSLLLVLAVVTAVAAVLATDVGRYVMAGATALLLLASLRFFRLAAHWREVEKR